ncbi:uncharacterized protein LOC132644447 [Lycium barbarum]|uniref:uncharacterized protein LOC132644447 n=1 Tax=Lycium barbarum TaxID=112863 RepID=UPI00293EC13B|nr:uncharacterized protein LOC132644447 [Lycium barbarum]
MCAHHLCVKEHRMETKKTWSTWEELLLAFAVKRHGFKDWESVAMELQTRSSLPAQLTPQICKDKYRELRRRFINSYDDEKEDDVDANGDVAIPWIEDLRKLRVAELKQELQRYDLSIQSLQLKVKKMEEEREESLKEESLKPDLEDLKEERSQNDKNSGAHVKPASSIGKSDSDRENRSFNESNSTENRETGVKNEPEPVEDKPVQQVVKPVSAEDSYNDSSSDRHEEEKKTRPDSASGSKENSDVQSTATLTKRKRQRGGGDAAEMGGSPAVGIKAAKSEPLIEFLHIIRSNKRGSVFKRRLDSQKTDKYKSMIRQHMDLETVQARIDDGSYCSCSGKFYLDLLLIFNNAIVYFPKSSPESTAANELRGVVMEELKKTRTQSKDPTPRPRSGLGPPLAIQPKPELERSDSLLAKHKSTVPIVVCRKRSSISAKAAASGNDKPEKQADNKPPKPPIKSSSNEEDSSIKLGMKEKPVTGVRSMRRSSKGRPNSNASQSINNQSTNTKQTNGNVDKKEEAKPEKKKEEAKKRGAAADFLKRIKKNSPTKGTLVEALKNNPTEDAVVKGNKREQQKKKVDERREAPVRRSGGGGKEEGSPSKRSVGRPPKRGGREVVQEKRARENNEKDDSSKRPKKRSRR